MASLGQLVAVIHKVKVGYHLSGMTIDNTQITRTQINKWWGWTSSVKFSPQGGKNDARL